MYHIGIAKGQELTRLTGTESVGEVCDLVSQIIANECEAGTELTVGCDSPDELQLLLLEIEAHPEPPTFLVMSIAQP